MNHLALTMLVFSAATIAAADDPTFAGTWKENNEKSHLTGQTKTYTKLPSGMLHYSQGATEYDYQYDGKGYEIRPGLVRTSIQSGETSWKWTDTKDGTMRIWADVRLSKDGNTLETSYSFYRPDGQTENAYYVSERVSGGPGILGTWKETQVNFAAWTIVIEMPAADEISIRGIEAKSSWHGKCDGSDVAQEGALVLKGATLACKRIDARTIEWTDKRDGKVSDMRRWTLSADGQSLESVFWALGHESEKRTTIYDRQ